MNTHTMISAPIAILDTYLVLNNISSHNNFKVKLVKDSRTSKIYICKLLKIRPVSNINLLRNNFYKEIDLLQDSSHEHLIKLIDYSECSSYRKNNHYFYECMYYIMEYCDKGTLFDYLTQYPFGIIEENTKEIFKQIIAALGYLHSKGYAHGDIRLENFVRTNETFIKIIDFGFLKKIDVKSNEFHGSNYYMAPEILNHEEYLPEKADVFAAGCVLIALTFGCPAFYCASRTDKWYRMLLTNPDLFWSQHQTRINRTISRELRNLIENMLKINSEDRIGLDNILNDPWLQM